MKLLHLHILCLILLPFVVKSESKAVNFLYDSDPDTAIVFHPHQYFVELDSLVLEDTIEALLEDLNSVEIWHDDDLNMGVWQVISFPFLTGDGNEIHDINEVVSASKKKTRIRSSSLNIQQTISANEHFGGVSCFDLSKYSYAVGGEKVYISILDTGISDISDNSTSDFNYNLQGYTGYDYINNDSIPDDEHGHGSHLAGLIHSIVYHEDPDSTNVLFDIRKTHDSLGQAYTSNIVFALIDAVRSKADIINMSFGVQDIYHDSLFFPLEHAIQFAENEGTLVIASAGNNAGDNDVHENTSLPASFPLENVISVASSNCEHGLSDFSNYGSSTVDVVIEGENIPGPGLGTEINELSGTSLSAAIVTALTALKATHLNDFDFQKIKCALIHHSQHYIDLTDKLVADGSVDVLKFMMEPLLDCADYKDLCNTALTNEEQLTGMQLTNKIYETDMDLASDQVIVPQVQLTYDVQQSVDILNGFEIQAGAIFQVQKDGCNH